MKKLILVTTLLFLLFNSCSSSKKKEKDTSIKVDRVESGFSYGDIKFYLIEVDSCEYLTTGQGSARTMTHKGNCKYCEKDREDE